MSVEFQSTLIPRIEKDEVQKQVPESLNSSRDATDECRLILRWH